MKKKIYYEMIVHNLQIIKEVNQSVKKHYPSLAIPMKIINEKLKLAKGKLEKYGYGSC
jgi:hypothetical protein